MASTKLQNASNLATVLAAAVAADTFYYGYRQFKETQQVTRDTLTLQRETIEQENDSKAVDLFIKYNELMAESRSSPKSAKGEAVFWRDNLAISIAESIFKLRRDDEGWRETVAWMLGNHTDFLKENGLNCVTFDGEFVKFVNQQMHQDMCRAP